MVQHVLLPWVTDNDTYNIWDNWCIENRDIIFLNKQGYYISKININDGYDDNETDIINLINELLNDN